MITQEELQELGRIGAQDGQPMLTVYLNVDQRDASNLNQGFMTTLTNLLRNIERDIKAEDERAQFQENADRVRAFVEAHAPKRKTLAIFADAARDVFKHYAIETPVESSATWRPAPYLRPLAEAQDEYQRYAVILAGRAQARLFTVVLGEIEEELGILAEADVRQFDASGKDKMWSQMSFQRQADEHAKQHFKKIAEMLDSLETKGRFSRLVIAGPDEAPAELVNHLPERLRNLAIGRLALSFHAPEGEIVEKTVPLIRQIERSEEKAAVEKLVTMAAKNGKAVGGLEDTVDACLHGRVRTLVYSRDAHFVDDLLARSWDRIREARHAAGMKADPPVQSMVDWLVWTTLNYGGAVEYVREEAAAMLEEEAATAGIGAFLR